MSEEVCLKLKSREPPNPNTPKIISTFIYHPHTLLFQHQHFNIIVSTFTKPPSQNLPPPSLVAVQTVSLNQIACGRCPPGVHYSVDWLPLPLLGHWVLTHAPRTSRSRPCRQGGGLTYQWETMVDGWGDTKQNTVKLLVNLNLKSFKTKILMMDVLKR